MVKGWRNRRAVQGSKESKQQDELIQRRRAGKTVHEKSLREQSLGEDVQRKTRRVEPKETKPTMKMDTSFKGKWVRRWVLKTPGQRLPEISPGLIRDGDTKKRRAPSPGREMGRSSTLGGGNKVDQQGPSAPQGLRLKKKPTMGAQPCPLLYTELLFVPWAGYKLSRDHLH